MTYEQRDMSGSLFRNDKREKETHPHARGTATIDGVAYFVDAWTKETKDGAKWQSLSFKKKENQKGARKVTQTRRQHVELEDDSDLPF